MEYNFKSKLAALRTFWDKSGIRLNAGISELLIDNFQNEISYTFEENFYIYLKEINGFIDFDSDQAWFCFWDLQRMRIENSDNSHPRDLIWFSDYSINLCSFGFHKIDKKVYTHFQHSDKILLIANDFDEFIDMYLADANSLIK